MSRPSLFKQDIMGVEKMLSSSILTAPNCRNLRLLTTVWVTEIKSHWFLTQSCLWEKQSRALFLPLKVNLILNFQKAQARRVFTLSSQCLVTLKMKLIIHRAPVIESSLKRDFFQSQEQQHKILWKQDSRVYTLDAPKGRQSDWETISNLPPKPFILNFLTFLACKQIFKMFF